MKARRFLSGPATCGWHSSCATRWGCRNVYELLEYHALCGDERGKPAMRLGDLRTGHVACTATGRNFTKARIRRAIYVGGRTASVSGESSIDTSSCTSTTTWAGMPCATRCGCVSWCAEADATWTKRPRPFGRRGRQHRRARRQHRHEGLHSCDRSRVGPPNAPPPWLPRSCRGGSPTPASSP